MFSGLTSGLSDDIFNDAKGASLNIFLDEAEDADVFVELDELECSTYLLYGQRQRSTVSPPTRRLDRHRERYWT